MNTTKAIEHKNIWSIYVLLNLKVEYQYAPFENLVYELPDRFMFHVKAENEEKVLIYLFIHSLIEIRLTLKSDSDGK